VAKHVRADAVGRDARVRRQFANQLEQPHTAQMAFARRE
jgi:hypothetical protein